MNDTRALTLPQPHATLVMLGVQQIVTMPKPFPETVPLPARILIHASKRKPDDWWGGGYGVVRTTRPFAARLWSDQPHERVALPLGAVLGWVTVTDSLPIVDFKPIHPRCTPLDDHRQSAVLDVHGDELTYWWHHDAGFRDMTDQLPYGDFTPGRFGWLCADPAPFPEPIGEYPCVHCGPGTDYEYGEPAPCGGSYRCDGVFPVRGHQGLWRPDDALLAALPVEASDDD